MTWSLDEIWHKLSISWGEYADFSEIEDIYNFVMVVVCVICAGLAAGLTVGLLSLDETKLEIKMMTGTASEKAAATRILPIIKQHHLLLVTLLLFNSVANETLPIFLGSLVPNYLAVIISVSLVLIFGEIIPSALFTGPTQLLTAARLTGLVYFLFMIFYPIAFPISLILDYIFGKEDTGNAFSRSELEALVRLQGTSDRHLQSPPPQRPSYTSQPTETTALLIEAPKESLTPYEVNLMTGILKLSKCTVQEAMIPMNRVFMISSSTRLNEKALYDILDSGFSRIPVFQRRDKQFVLGYLLVKELIVVNPLENLMIEDIPLREPLCVPPTIGLMELLSIFQAGQCHLALVSTHPPHTLENLRRGQRPQSTEDRLLGIVTMEDVLEKIIQCDIQDETDDQDHYSIVQNQFYPHGGAPTLFLYQNARRQQQYQRYRTMKPVKQHGTIKQYHRGIPSYHGEEDLEDGSWNNNTRHHRSSYGYGAGEGPGGSPEDITHHSHPHPHPHRLHSHRAIGSGNTGHTIGTNGNGRATTVKRKNRLFAPGSVVTAGADYYTTNTTNTIAAVGTIGGNRHKEEAEYIEQQPQLQQDDDSEEENRGNRGQGQGTGGDEAAHPPPPPPPHSITMLKKKNNRKHNTSSSTSSSSGGSVDMDGAEEDIEEGEEEGEGGGGESTSSSSVLAPLGSIGRESMTLTMTFSSPVLHPLRKKLSNPIIHFPRDRDNLSSSSSSEDNTGRGRGRGGAGEGEGEVEEEVDFSSDGGMISGRFPTTITTTTTITTNTVPVLPSTNTGMHTTASSSSSTSGGSGVGTGGGGGGGGGKTPSIPSRMISQYYHLSPPSLSPGLSPGLSASAPTHSTPLSPSAVADDEHSPVPLAMRRSQAQYYHYASTTDEEEGSSITARASHIPSYQPFASTRSPAVAQTQRKHI